MPQANSPRDILAETMSEGRKVVVPYLAEMLKTERISEVPTAEERRLFWARAKTPEQEAQMWTEALAQRGLAPEMLTPEVALDIGLGIAKEVYPGRWDMMGQEGRTTQADQARWAAKHAKLGPPTAMQEGEQGEA